jgi:indolepyruvate ferredoxin oxidoreductase
VPDPPAGDRSTAVIRLAGIGGTGVVSAAQIIGTAAMLDGWDVDGLDQTGLSQKAGPVVSDLTLVRPGGERRAKLVGGAQADTLVAFDQLVAASPATLAASSPERTTTLASTASPPVGARISHPERAQPSAEELGARLRQSSRPGGYHAVDAAGYATALTGVGATANIFLVGAAVQGGHIPVKPERVRHAIELNGVAVEANVAAFEWGRRWATDPGAVAAAAGRRQVATTEVATPPLPRSLARRVERVASDPETAALLTMLAGDLVAYQDRSYAGRFLDLVEEAAAAEARVGEGHDFTRAVARGYHKLLAYKDEYEVARLMLGDDGLAAARAAGGPDADITWHLHPPTLKAAGVKHKVAFGPWARPAFTALAAGKRVRGTALDPFGRSEVRRLERQLPVEYAGAVRRVAGALTAARLADAVEVAALPDQVRGYDDLKLRRAGAYRAELAARVAALADGVETRTVRA